LFLFVFLGLPKICVFLVQETEDSLKRMQERLRNEELQILQSGGDGFDDGSIPAPNPRSQVCFAPVSSVLLTQNKSIKSSSQYQQTPSGAARVTGSLGGGHFDDGDGLSGDDDDAIPDKDGGDDDDDDDGLSSDDLDGLDDDDDENMPAHAGQDGQAAGDDDDDLSDNF
jgi:hypothetical protein